MLITQDTEIVEGKLGEKFVMNDILLTIYNSIFEIQFLGQRDLDDKVSQSSSKLRDLLRRGIPKENRGEVRFSLSNNYYFLITFCKMYILHF